MSDFQQTVDLRKKVEKIKRPAEELEKIFTAEAAKKNNLQTISRPKIIEPREGLIKTAVLILAFLLIIATVYFLFFRTKGGAADIKARAWYAVKLVDGEIFYGQIADTKADPIAIANVYYNYDQSKEKDPAKAIPETGNIRLVKRGQETHGPSGSMDVVRSQVLFMEPLKADSKVLKAILDYEK